MQTCAEFLVHPFCSAVGLSYLPHLRCCGEGTESLFPWDLVSDEMITGSQIMPQHILMTRRIVYSLPLLIHGCKMLITMNASRPSGLKLFEVQQPALSRPRLWTSLMRPFFWTFKSEMVKFSSPRPGSTTKTSPKSQELAKWEWLGWSHSIFYFLPELRSHDL